MHTEKVYFIKQIVHLSQAVIPSRQKRGNQVGSEKKQEKNKIPYKALYLPSYAMISLLVYANKSKSTTSPFKVLFIVTQF